MEPTSGNQDTWSLQYLSPVHDEESMGALDYKNTTRSDAHFIECDAKADATGQLYQTNDIVCDIATGKVYKCTRAVLCQQSTNPSTVGVADQQAKGW